MRASVSSLGLCLVSSAFAANTSFAQFVVEPPGTRQPVGLTTPRIAPLPESRWTEEHKRIITTFARDDRADNGLKTLLNLPALAEAVMPYTNYLLDESSLLPRHRALLVLRAAWLCGSEPIWASHAARAKDAGLSAADLRRIAQGPDTPGWDGFEQTLLRLADELYRNSSVTNATWIALAAQYDIFHLMDAVETVNHFVALSMTYNAFGVQPDEGLTARLPNDVPYRIVVPKREPALTVARVEPASGRGIAVNRTFGRYPALNTKWGPRQGFILRVSRLYPRHREMLILRMGWNCRAEYEWAKHVGSVGRARDHGLDPAQIAEGPQAAVWEAFERALLRASDELFHDGTISDQTWHVLSSRVDTGLVMSAIFSTANYRAISMSLNAYGVQFEEGDERFPPVPSRR